MSINIIKIVDIPLLLLRIMISITINIANIIEIVTQNREQDDKNIAIGTTDPGY